MRPKEWDVRLHLMPSPQDVFWSPHYREHNDRRLAHLASLELDLSNQKVLEVGAGIGDHTQFFLDRDDLVVVTEPRPEKLEILRMRYPGIDIRRLDLDDPTSEP